MLSPLRPRAAAFLALPLLLGGAVRAADTAVTPAAEAPPSAVPPATVTAALQREIVLELGRRTLSLRENGKVIGSWPVAIGDPGTPTPPAVQGGEQGRESPVPEHQERQGESGAGAQRPLGDRWIGFKSSGPNQYGIHGTPSAWSWTVSSRAAVTNGCVRLFTDHVRKLFDLVEVGTPVLVTR